VVTALYRRYRPETFAELIGQSQVTDPLRTALRTDRVNHAYLFSGPRGCGKTTSARILARCLNCAEGPTDTPCGVCASCVELSRDGGGSLDVVEIDAASHGGVDDARDLRERAIFAPARDRYKIFILDEAHMVTATGFNALLKIVEEPPEHVKFIFATTEPEKVIGTIRSRTHHYPFRLVPPAQMLEYVQQLCDSEKVTVEPGVLSLVVRAGGGSVRDTLSLLDQLIAGSEGTVVEYERAVALLGYTHGTLLNEAVEAIGQRDNAAVFGAVDRVIQTGQDPRRFVEDLLERLRDLIIVAATADHAAAVLRGIPADELTRMAQQAASFGQAELSRTADIVNAALTEMTGATSPRLHLELMVARILVPASDETERGALARVERLERRVGVESPGGAPSQRPAEQRPVASRPPAAASVAPPRTAAPAVPAAAAPAANASVGAARPAAASSVPASAQAPAAAAPAAQTPAASAPAQPVAATSSWPAVAVPGAPRAADAPAAPSAPVPAASVSAAPSTPAPEAASVVPRADTAAPSPADAPVAADAPADRANEPDRAAQAPAEPEIPVDEAVAALESAPSVSANAPAQPAGDSASTGSATETGPATGADSATDVSAASTSSATEPAPVSVVTLQQMKDAWPEVLEIVQKANMNAWTVVFNAQVRALDGDILALVFSNQTDQAKFKELTPSGDGVSAILRSAIIDVLGLRVKFIAQVSIAPDSASQRPVTAAASPAGTAARSTQTAPPADDEAPEPTEPDVEPGGWAVAAIPPSAPTEDELHAQRAAARKPAAKVVPVPTAEDSRYGESVVREILGASFIEEQPVAPRVVPKDL
jgi:DNA polymerase-3 subunit gamma/tau